MNPIFQPTGNAVLMRELRASLRNARPFALIALYVAVLGAIVISSFPANQEIQITLGTASGNRGKDLYWTFVLAQAALIFLVLPAIAAGALSQEREQRTLEPLLLTPLTPLQIVWGKAVGVLSLGGLLLVSTLPLTSLCFLLGGVSPGELIAAYIVLLGLALFTASIGIYCSAKWTNTVHATLWTYFLMPFFLMFLALFSGIGIIVAALAMFGFVLHLVSRAWGSWGRREVKREGKEARTLSQKLGALWVIAGGLLLIFTAVVLIYVMARDQNIGSISFGGFAIAYLIFISQIALQQAAREIVRVPESSGPARQKMQDFQSEWKTAMSTPAPYLPETSLLDAQREIQRQEYSHAVQATQAAPENNAPIAPSTEKETYGKAPFLSDKLNPIYAKDLRSGLVGKFEYLLRFSYVAVIGSELLLLFLAVAAPAQPVGQEWDWFRVWSSGHLIALLCAGAWLGARSIAPEHEQQTLTQLIMTPLSPFQIVTGKVQAVMTYTFYVFILGVPLAVLLAALKVVTWRAASCFLLIEIVFGALAAAWGIFCSLHARSTRRALALSLGGVFIIAIAGLLFDNFVQQGFKILYGRTFISPALGSVLSALLSPLRLLEVVLNPSSFIAATSVSGVPLQAAAPASSLPVASVLFLSLGLWSLVALLLLWSTARSFGKYADTI